MGASQAGPHDREWCHSPRFRPPHRWSPTRSESISPTRRSTSSSAPSTERTSAGQPPAITPTTISGGSSEGGRTFRRVKHAEPAAGSGADVDESAAGAERGLDKIDGRRDIDAGAGDGAGNGGVFGADEINDLERGGGIDGGAARITPFGQACVEEVVSHAS